jgi:hypothetical protein
VIDLVVQNATERVQSSKPADVLELEPAEGGTT